jgi:signal transduction histidine kinase
VRTDGDSEFDELAKAFNTLASRLEESEERKVETIGQIGCTLNHELNNALTIIELKLRPLARQASGNAALEQSVGQIRENLGRMARTVESLKRVRRIILTDYVSGVKMVDLEQSLQEGPRVAAGTLSGA